MPRLSIYISKINYTHDLIYNSGVFTLHLLRNDQWDLIWHLGLQSGREVNKLDATSVFEGVTGCPILEDCIAGFECTVVNAMDTGASTFFLGEVVHVWEGDDGPIMSSEYFREHMPAERRLQYEANLRAASSKLEVLTRSIDSGKVWPGPIVAP